MLKEVDQERDYQFFLPIGKEAIDLVNQRLTNKRRERKIGLLTRMLHDRANGALYQDIRRIEDNFKAGGSRTTMYFYNTKEHGRRTVEATPEDIKTVLDRRQTRLKAR